MNMVNLLATSKIQSNYQTTIPKEIRKNFDVEKGMVVEWSINEKGRAEIFFRRKRDIRELKGLVKLDYPTDSVKLKRELYNHE